MKPLIERVGAERFARWEERLRKHAVRHLPDRWVIDRYSQGRETFLDVLKRETVPEPYDPPAELAREFWGLEFQSPAMNAAGMFKSGDYYDLVADQGAGAFLAGTFTPEPRTGNRQWGIERPFLPLPASGASLNSLGLPNPGFREDDGARRRRREMGYERSARGTLEGVDSRPGVPLGASVMGTPAKAGEEGYAGEIVEGLTAVSEAGVDFAEINESCPNTGHALPQGSGLAARLEHVAEAFLADHDLPVIVKLTVDTPPEQVADIVDLLLETGFHGVTFGNASDQYDTYREDIEEGERDAYTAFTEHIGGGVGGVPIRQRSLELAGAAAERVRERDPDRGFMVVRTGGVASTADVRDSEARGIDMNQWFTGYWEGFADHGHDVYRELFDGVA